MRKRRLQFNPTVSFMSEALESRVVMSAAALNSAVAQIAARTAKVPATQSTLSATAGTLGQPIMFTMTVKAPVGAGSPQGTVHLMYRGQVVQSQSLVNAAATNGRFAESKAVFVLTPERGGPAFFFGRHAFTARFVPTGGLGASSASALVNVARPPYTDLGNGVKVVAIEGGSGEPIQAGQTASLLYTGYLAKTGTIFDDSAQHGGAPLSFQVGTGQVIPGFDAGVLGMKPGETRIILIPPAQGYGKTANGPIPGNSTLIFVVKLQSIS